MAKKIHEGRLIGAVAGEVADNMTPHEKNLLNTFFLCVAGGIAVGFALLASVDNGNAEQTPKDQMNLTVPYTLPETEVIDSSAYQNNLD